MTKTSLICFICLIVLALAAPLTPAAADDSPFVRYPALSPDGSEIAFCFQGDIWTLPVNGGEAKRLTIHEAYDARPKWSRDGKRIAFSSNRFGGNDIFIIPADGGRPLRMTWHSAFDTVNQWTPDGRLLFTTSRLFRQVERIGEIFTVPVEGGTPSRYMDALGDMPVMSPDKRYIAFTRGSCRIAREQYRGPANRDVWLYDIKAKTYTQLTKDEGNDFSPQWGEAGVLYFISGASGRYNVHAMTLTANGGAGEIRQVTQFKDGGVRYLETAADGKTMVMEQDTAMYTMKTDADKPARVPVTIRADYRFDPVEYKKLTAKADEFAVSPNGKLTAFVVRGEVFIKENDKENSRAVNLSRHPYRDHGVTWLNDTSLIFTSDRDGAQELYLVQSADSKEKNLYKTLKHKTLRLTNTPASEHEPVMSPDLKKIAFLRDRGQLVTADISADGKFSNEKLLLDGWAVPEGVCWSPDSRWLAYALEDLNFNAEVFIHAADNTGKPVNISMHPRLDYWPAWSPDGSKLGFVSNRNNGDDDVWFVWLRKKDWEKTKQDWKEDKEEPKKEEPKKDEKGKKGDKKKKEKKKAKPVIIDFEDIHERLVQVTRSAGDEQHPVISKDGKTFYYSAMAPTAKSRDLYSVKWDGTKPKAVTRGGQKPRVVRLDGAGKYIYLLKIGGSLARIGVKAGKLESLPFSGRMRIDHKQEMLQVFNDASLTLEKGFYDPKYHGKNWKQLIAKYKPMALKASTKRDFRDMFNVMLGQLNASHMGLYGADRGTLQRQGTGLLGAAVEPVKTGVRVTHVTPGSPAHRVESRLNTGDIITSVDGEPVKPSVNFYSLLINRANEKVLLTVKNKSGEEREVVLRPTNRLFSQLYDEWVKERRRLTEKYSNGRLGYLHIRAMGWDSFERFEREIMACGYGKEGIVIDVRFNGGGWTTDYLMAVLTVRQHAYTIPRGAAKDLKKEHKKFRKHYAFGERLPFAAWTHPSIALCNENSYSNAEIFSHAYKTLDIGTLVGAPTFGAVISTSGKMLLDGSFVRLPFRAWYVKATDENMENGPAVPDILVQNAPDDKANGKDTQLKRAVEELLKQIDK